MDSASPIGFTVNAGIERELKPISLKISLLTQIMTTITTKLAIATMQLIPPPPGIHK